MLFERTPVLADGNPVLNDDGNPTIDLTQLASSGKRAEDFDALYAALAPPARAQRVPVSLP